MLLCTAAIKHQDKRQFQMKTAFSLLFPLEKKENILNNVIQNSTSKIFRRGHYHYKPLRLFTDILRTILWHLCEFLFVTELSLLNRSLFNSCHSYQDNGIFSSSCSAIAGGGCGLSLHEEAEQRCNIDTHVLSDVVIMTESDQPRSRNRIPQVFPFYIGS